MTKKKKTTETPEKTLAATEPPRPKCIRDSTKVWCSGMDRALEGTEANERKRGIHVSVLTNFKTGAQRIAGLVYRKSAKDRGVALNRCPFCGEDVFWWEVK